MRISGQSVSESNNVLTALAGTNCGQQNETLRLTYEALVISIAIYYTAAVWSRNASDSSLEKMQRTQNEALWIITGSHKMASIDHIHSETKMSQVEDHLNLLSAQYVVHCLDTENVCHHNPFSTYCALNRVCMYSFHTDTTWPLSIVYNHYRLSCIHL